jgi:ankyrin repeat protein
VRVLLGAGANCSLSDMVSNARNNVFACWYMFPFLISLNLQSQKNVHVRNDLLILLSSYCCNKSNRTPLDAAATNGHVEVMKLLLTAKGSGPDCIGVSVYVALFIKNICNLCD